MTVESTAFYTDWYLANGANKTWNYDFAILAESNITILVRDGTDDSTSVKYTNGFSFNPNSDYSAGTITFPATGDALAAGKQLRIVRSMDFLQTTEIGMEGNFSPILHERAFDKLTMQTQELKEGAERAIKVPLGFSGYELSSTFADYTTFMKLGDLIVPGPTAAQIQQAETSAEEAIAAKDAAETAAASAVSQRFGTVSELLATTQQFSAGVYLAASNYRYLVVEANEHLSTAGGVKLRVVPVNGVFAVEAWADVVTEDIAQSAIDAVCAMKAALDSLDPYNDRPYYAPFKLVCSSSFTVSKRLILRRADGTRIFGIDFDWRNAKLTAVAGGSLTATTPMLQLILGGSEVWLPSLDCSRIASGYRLEAMYASRVYHPDAINVAKGGWGCRVTGQSGNLIIHDPRLSEMHPSYPEAQATGQSAYDAVGLYADTADFWVIGGHIGWAKYPVQLTSNAGGVYFVGVHIASGGLFGTTKWQDAIIVYSEAYDRCFFFDCYLDNGYTIDNGAQLTMQNCHQHYLTSQVTLSDPLIKVKCTAAKSGTLPTSARYNVEGASIGFFADDTNTYNWASAGYANLASLYSYMYGTGGEFRTLGHETLIYNKISNEPSKRVFQPSGRYVEQYINGGSSSFWSEWTDSTQDDKIIRQLVPDAGQRIVREYAANSAADNNLTLTYSYRSDDTIRMIVTQTDITFSLTNGRMNLPSGLRVGRSTDLDNNTGTETGAYITPGGQARMRVSGAAIMDVDRTTSDGPVMTIRRDATVVGSISSTASGTAFNTTSDATLKEDLGNLSFYDATAVIERLSVHDFNWKVDGSHDIGFFAQELYEVYPRAVTPGGWFKLVDEAEVECEEGDEGAHYRPWGVDHSRLVPVFARCLQELLIRTNDASE